MSLVDLDEMRVFKEGVRELEQLIDTAIMLGLEETLVKAREGMAKLRAEHQEYVDNFHAGQVGGFSI